MRPATLTLAVVVPVASLGLAGAAILSRADAADTATATAAAPTANVTRGRLAATTSANGTLTYRARPDGSPYPLFNGRRGVYTQLPASGDRVRCGDALLRVDDHPVLLLCGTVPAYRDLRLGDAGRDVRQLNRNLRALHADRRAGVDLRTTGGAFTSATADALRELQRRVGLRASGRLGAADAVVAPGAVRVAKVAGQLGGPARPGTLVAQATSDALLVRIDMAPTGSAVMSPGDPARIALPDHRTVRGRVDRLGAVSTASPADSQRGGSTNAPTIPVFIRLDDPRAARGLDGAPVRVEVTTGSVDRALQVPSIAVVGTAGGGNAVEVLRDDDRRELVAVRLGLFDATSGRVQVDGRLKPGDRVVVPTS